LFRPILALLLLAGCATPYQPFEGRPVLAAIRFEGNDHISSGDLLGLIATAPTSGFFSKTARYYDADLFAIDLKRIERWYNEKGFYQAKVQDVAEERDDKGRVTLVVKIEEGRRAFVDKMDFKGLENLAPGEASDIDDQLPVHPGEGFDEDVYERAKDVLLEQLRARGFAQARVSGRVEVAPDAGTAHILFESETGERFKFGKVSVSGNHRVAADEIAFATGIERGDPYTPKAIALAQQRVYNLGAFSGVRVGLDPLGDTPVAAVRVNVREAPYQTVRLGIGGSAEEGRWELPRLRAEYTNRSLLGGLRRLELSSTAGYAFVPNPFPGQYNADHSGITTLSSAQLTVPNIIIPGLEWISRMEYAREIQNGFSYQDVAARTGGLYRRGPHAVSASLNFVRYFKVDLRGTDLQTVTGAAILRDCPKACTLTYPELRYTYDGRDNLIEPSQGFYGSVSLQQTLKPGSFSYFRINPDLRAYVSFFKYVVLAMRAEYGGLFTETALGESPFTQRFFFGGQNEQRGYGPLQQGPKLGATPCAATVSGCTQPYASKFVPIGGKAAALVSAELRIRADWLLNHLMIVPFVDASAVGDDPKRPLSNGFEVSPGLGLRYITPFGPVRLDVAYLLNPKDVTTEALKDATGKVIVAPSRVSVYCPDNTPGCIGYSRIAFHVTLGEAF
jgi:translocation and assembly module TamA